MSSEKRVALVSGGSRGIGAAIARRLGRAGAAVLVAARNLEECVDVADGIREEGGVAWPIHLDVADTSTIRRAVREATSLAEDVGPLGWLVNNAGIAASAPLFSHADSPGANDELFRRHLDVNLHGTRRLIEALVPAMRDRGYGRVVNVASSAGLRGYAYVAAYCTSKFALVGYTLAAAAELADSGVTVNAVCPHYVDSPMLDRSIEQLMEKTGRSEEELRVYFERQNPGGRLVTTEEVAEAVTELLQGDRTATLVELDGAVSRVRRPNAIETDSNEGPGDEEDG